MLRTDRIHLRLFVQGVECPISDCTVSTAVMPTAVIDVLPTPELLNIRPGSQVVVTYYDPFGAPPVTEAAPTQYSLLFCGYIRSMQVSHAATSRGATLRCEGDITLLDRMQTYFFDTTSDLLRRRMSFVGASQFQTGITGVAQLGQAIARAFDPATTVLTPGFEGVYGAVRGVVSLIEHAVGVAVGQNYITQTPTAGTSLGQLMGDAAKSGRYAQNDFFAVMEAQTHLLYQIGGLPQDLTAFAVLKEATAKDAIAQLGEQVNGLTDLLTLLRIIVGRAYHGMYAVSTARALPTAPVVNRDSFMQIRADIFPTQTGATVSDLLGKLFVTDPLTDLQNLALQVTNSEPEVGSLLPFLTPAATAWYTRVDPALLHYVNAELYRVLRDNINTEQAEDGKYVWTGQVDVAGGFRAIADLTSVVRVLAATQGGPAAATHAAPRLMNYLILPDLFFSTPPACNVIFPNQVSSLTYNSAGMDRPTRLQLTVDPGDLRSTGDAPTSTDRVTVLTYFAPTVGLFTASQGALQLTVQMNMDPLLPHERYTGIVPVFKNISKLDTMSAANAQRLDPNDKEIFLRLANFQLLDARYQSGQLAVSGPFNPFACPGFPCAVMDSIGESYSQIYVGLLQSVSHSVSTGNASTSYVITHARPAMETDEIFKQLEGADEIGAEDLCRPIWYDEQYALAKIGKALYEPLLGCVSVQDKVPTGELVPDTFSYDINTKQKTPTYKTSTALAHVHKVYNSLPSQVARQQYVHAYTYRPVADQADIVGPYGLYAWVSTPAVANAAGECPPGMRPTQGTVAAGRAPILNPLDVIQEKRAAAEKYVAGTRKDAFR
jgi:hypothetical protein